MPIIVACPTCKAKMKAPDNLIGKMVKCPGCGNAVTVKAAGSSSSIPASAPAPAPKKPVRPAPPPPPPVEETEPVEDEIEPSAPMHADASEMEEQIPASEPGGPTTEKERSTAMWIHLLPILLGWCCGIGNIIPLVLWVSKRKESPFIDHHGKAWLNWIINLFVIGFVLGIFVAIVQGIGGFIGGVVSYITTGLTVLILLAYSLVVLVMQVMVGLKAKKGEWAQYKLLFKVLK